MWADVDTKQDFLNCSEVAQLVGDVVRDPTMRPVTVGVLGTWGTGKSTLLNLIEEGLNPTGTNQDFVVVRFVAWLYQGCDDSRAALMEVIASRLIEATENKPGVIEQAKKLFGRVNRMVPNFERQHCDSKAARTITDVIRRLWDERVGWTVLKAAADRAYSFIRLIAARLGPACSPKPSQARTQARHSDVVV